MEAVSECQQFKAAFLQCCVEDGLSLDEIHELVKFGLSLNDNSNVLDMFDEWGKSAAGLWDAVSPIAKLPGDTVAGAAKMLPSAALGLYLGIPTAVGAAGGYAASQLTNLNDEDPDEIKMREKIDTYRRNAQQLELNKRLHATQQQRRPSRPLY